MDVLELRQYQRECFEAVQNSYRKGFRRVLVSAPTGTGKTVIFSVIGKSVLAKGNKCLVLVNTDELVNQTVEKFAAIGVPAGVVKCERNEWDEGLVVASIQTLSRKNRLAQIPASEFKLIIIDECHYSMAASYQRVMEHFKDAYMLGLSATLFRGDRVSLAKAGWQYISYVYTIKQAIEDKFLVPPVAYKIETATDVSAVRVKASGDFDETGLSKTVNTVERNDTIVDAWLERAVGRQTIAFCCDVAHSFDLANAFRKRNVDARVIWGDMQLDARRETLRLHKAGAFPIVCNCAVLTHGYDDPGVSCVMMCRPTQSKVLAVQCIGRGLRPSPGKVDCLVLDFVDMSTKHKLVTTADIAELQTELARRRIGVEVEVGEIGTVEEEKKKAKDALPKKPKFSNEDGTEEWKARQRDLLGGDGKQRDKRIWHEDLATEKQRWWMFGVLTREFGWGKEVAERVAFNERLKKIGVRKLLVLVGKGSLTEEMVGKVRPVQHLEGVV